MHGMAVVPIWPVSHLVLVRAAIADQQEGLMPALSKFGQDNRAWSDLPSGTGGRTAAQASLARTKDSRAGKQP